MILNPVLSIWMQLASFSFTMSALFTDLFMIRAWLLCAYTCLFLNAVLGSPLWPEVFFAGHFSVDGFVWAVIGIIFHSMAFTSLLLDEREVKLEEETGEAPLWRMFYRSSGLSARLFKSILAKHMKVVEFEAGQEVPLDDYFYIVYTGEVMLKVVEKNLGETNVRIAKSGHMFDIKHVSHMICNKSIFETSDLQATCTKKTRMFGFRHDSLEIIAKNPLSKNIWQAILVSGLSSAIDTLSTSSGQSIHGGTEMVLEEPSHVFSLLEPHEMPKPYLSGSNAAIDGVMAFVRHYLHYTRHSFTFPWLHLSGIRHVSLPVPTSLTPSSDDVKKSLTVAPGDSEQCYFLHE